MNQFTYPLLPPKEWLILKRFSVCENVGRVPYRAEIVYLRKYRPDYKQPDALDMIIDQVVREKFPDLSYNVEEIISPIDIAHYKEKWLPNKDMFETPIRICPKITIDEMQALGKKEVFGFEFNVHTYIHKSDDEIHHDLYKYLGFLTYYPYTEEEERKLNKLICDPNSEKLQFLENL